jgi:PKD repeat protein
MKKLMLILGFVFVLWAVLSAQTVIIDFETEGDGYTPSETGGTGTTDLFNRVNPDIGGNDSYIWAMEDYNNNPSLMLEQIDIMGVATFSFSIDFLTPNTNDWDSVDELLITYSVDGGAYQNLMWVQSIQDATNYNDPAALDLAFDGDGDAGQELPAIVDDYPAGVGGDFVTFSTSDIAVSGSTLDIMLQFNGLTSTAEGIYLDNVSITLPASPIFSVSGTAPIGTILTHTGFNDVSPFEVVDGSYTFEAEVHSSVTIIPTKEGYYFEPESYSNSDLFENIAQDFTAFEMIPEISIEPNETNFGNVFINETAILPVVVYNIGQLDLVVSNVLVSTDRFAVSLQERDLTFTIAPSDSQIVNISFSPLLVEDTIGSIYFLTNDPNNTMLTYPVSGSGYVFEASFTAFPLSGDAPLNVQFTDNSVGDIQSWSWSFGDGQISNDQNPNHIYDYDGTYSVTLIVEDNYHQRTLTQEDLITVTGHPILSSSDSLGIDFGSLYFTDSSGDSLIIIQNIGTKAFQIDGLSFVENTGSFNFIYQNIGVPILPNESDTIFVNFYPTSVGTFEDHLLITNSSENHPSYEIVQSGACDYAPPKAPENVQVNVIYPDANVTWDEVTENIYDSPLTPDGYVVLFSEIPNQDDYFFFLVSVTEANYTHLNAAQWSEEMFYKVFAFVNYNRIQIQYLESVTESKEKIKWSDMKLHLDTLMLK